MRLYTAEAIKEQVHKLLCKDCEETDACSICDYRELIDEILDAPTVDAVEVVHCKDCQFSITPDWDSGEVYCTKYDNWFKLNGYCCLGRREDG